MLTLALLLIVSNSFGATIAMSGIDAGISHSSEPAHHHCHETPARATDKHLHGSSCPCCGSGCFCLHASGAPLPQFLIVPSVAPVTTLLRDAWAMPPAPRITPHLRPPIA